MNRINQATLSIRPAQPSARLNGVALPSGSSTFVPVRPKLTDSSGQLPPPPSKPSYFNAQMAQPSAFAARSESKSVCPNFTSQPLSVASMAAAMEYPPAHSPRPRAV